MYDYSDYDSCVIKTDSAGYRHKYTTPLGYGTLKYNRYFVPFKPKDERDASMSTLFSIHPCIIFYSNNNVKMYS